MKEITESYHKITGRSLTNNSQLGALTLLKDENSVKFFNLFRAFVLNDLSVTYFLIHEYGLTDRWDNLSVKYYDTPYLWWTIPLVNDIENPFETPVDGTNIKILKREYIYDLLVESRI